MLNNIRRHGYWYVLLLALLVYYGYLAKRLFAYAAKSPKYAGDYMQKQIPTSFLIDPVYYEKATKTAHGQGTILQTDITSRILILPEEQNCCHQKGKSSRVVLVSGSNPARPLPVRRGAGRGLVKIG